MSQGGIYQIRCLIDSKVYIGSAKNLLSRKDDHFKALRKNNHVNQHLQHAFNKYSEQKFIFEILEVLGDYNKLQYFERENFFIDKARELCIAYNIAKAEGGWTYHTHERKEEIRAKVSSGLRRYAASLSIEERKTKFGAHHLGEVRSPEMKAQISAKLIGITRSEETRKKMSNAQIRIASIRPSPLKGRKKSEETRVNMSKAQKGHPVSDEAKRKMRLAKLGKKLSLEHKSNISKAHQERLYGKN